MASKKTEKFLRRRMRVRNRLRKVSSGRARLSVHRSNRNINVQLIDDERGVTLASASSLEKSVAGGKGGNRDAAKLVGEEIAKRAKAAGIEQCYLDRGGCLFHGRIKALADAARAAGLNF
ncbi:MAG: 50S ribosomal protein L18 [Rhodobacteraceae bacterium]|nr:50S ribosomal protein L18 [Paracoccaceae bacterium]